MEECEFVNKVEVSPASRLLRHSLCKPISLSQETSYPVPEFDSIAIRSYEDISKNASRRAGDAELELVLDARPGER